jgi:uncharacterized protein (DUF885 family)
MMKINLKTTFLSLSAIALCCSLAASLPAVAASDLNGNNASESEMRSTLERYSVDRGSLGRFYTAPFSPARHARMKQFYSEWLGSLGKIDFDRMSQSGQVDYILFKNHLEYELRQLDIEEKKRQEMASLIPFAGEMVALEEARRRMDPVDSAKVASLLTRLSRQIDETRRAVEAGLRAEARPASIKVKKTVANRGAAAVGSLRNMLRGWYGFYSGYDPVFTWWAVEPYKAADQSLAAYATFLTEKVVGVRTDDATGAAAANLRPGGGRGPGAGPGGGPGGGRQGGGGARPTGARPGDASDIIGDPIGREALMLELASEMVPYTPEELIALAKKEMAWCEAEMKKASRDLGYGDDWLKALEHVKTLHVEPGKQPQLIRELALEAIEFVEKNEMVTVPPLARDTWRMEMMSPERQLVSPFFLGGETILVSFPTNTMAHEQKMMSMRGNNIHFSRATVHHELIPGHHLQGFMTARYRPYRGLFSTPFWGEGWALYWEFLLWDMNFARTPEDRIGMLFWRMHRCARIIFSLGFHLEQMTPQECIDLLVKGVGHEPDNATAEVRRSFAGQYGPLYQAAYMLGGLQFYALHRDLVKSGKMTNRDFHDAILKEGRIPVEMVRAILTRQKLTRDFKTGWKFYGPNPAG